MVLFPDKRVSDVDEGAEEEEDNRGPGEAEGVWSNFGVAAVVLELVAGFGEDGAGVC